MCEQWNDLSSVGSDQCRHSGGRSLLKNSNTGAAYIFERNQGELRTGTGEETDRPVMPREETISVRSYRLAPNRSGR